MTYTNGHTNGIAQHHVERLPAITSAVIRAGRRRAADQSQHLSRSGAHRAAAERCNTAVNRLIELAYQSDETGLCNVDDHTGVFERFPLPWGRSYTGWGLLRTEKDVLTLHIKKLQEAAEPAPLWTYDALSRRWALNLFDYPTPASATAYWKHCELTARDYQMLLQMVRNQRAIW